MPSPHIHIPYNRLNEHIGFIKDHKLDLEIYFGSTALDSLPETGIAELRSKLDYGPSLSIHAPFMDLSPGAVDSKVRKATMERFSHVLEIAEVLRPAAVVFHSGYEKWKYAFNIDLWLEKSVETWLPVNEKASEMGVKVAIENIFEDDPANLKLLMEKMDSDNFGVCFDTGHCNLFSKGPLEDWLEALNPFIFELHLHDNDRTADQHLPMGEGNFDFEKFFRLLERKDCLHTIEAHTKEHVLRSLEFLKRLKGI